MKYSIFKSHFPAYGKFFSFRLFLPYILVMAYIGSRYG